MEEKAKKELCDSCATADSKGVPCYLMFRKNTDLQTCGAHLEDPAGHAKLVAQHDKDEKAAGSKGGGK